MASCHWVLKRGKAEEAAGEKRQKKDRKKARNELKNRTELVAQRQVVQRWDDVSSGGEKTQVSSIIQSLSSTLWKADNYTGGETTAWALRGPAELPESCHGCYSLPDSSLCVCVWVCICTCACQTGPSHIVKTKLKQESYTCFTWSDYFDLLLKSHRVHRGLCTARILSGISSTYIPKSWLFQRVCRSGQMYKRLFWAQMYSE